MTTQSWSTPIDHTSDAGFRAWVAEVIAKVIAAGLVQTSDTGQVNTATVTRPGTNTNAGYAIFRFNDTQQGTAPIFLRIDFGTGTAVAIPRMQITVGPATNGAGTLTGTALTTARTITGTGTISSTVTSFQSYACHTEGFFGIAWKMGPVAGSTSTPYACFLLSRSCSASGVPDARGAVCMWASGATSAYTAYQYLRFASPAAAYTAQTGNNTLPVVVPGQPTSSLNSAGNNQAYLWWMAVPDVVPVLGWLTIVRSEAGIGSTFTMIPIGSTSHTYIPIGQAFPSDPATNTNYGPAMLWE